MKTTKSAEIKTRCTTELKEKLNEIAKQKNVSVSTIITSCLEACIYYGNPSSNATSISSMVDKQIFKNAVFNTIAIDPSIPQKSKERLMEVMKELC
nr:hypothetical protein [uncultured Blautia sp.]